MAMTEKYADFDLASGANDGTTEANAWQTWAAVVAGVAAGDRVNVQRTAARFGSGATVTLSTAGTDTNPIIYRGYATTIGDGGKFQSDDQFSVTGVQSQIEDFDVELSSTSAVMTTSGAGVRLLKSRFVNTSTAAGGGSGVSATDTGVVYGCYIENRSTGTNDASNAAAYGSRALFVGCVIKGSGNAAALSLYTPYRFGGVVGCSIDANGDIGIYINGQNDAGVPFPLLRNSIYDASDAVYIVASPDLADGGGMSFCDNIFYSVTNGIVNADAGSNSNGFVFINNAMGAVTTARISGFGSYEEVNPISLTGDPFTAAATGDFSLNNTAGAGAACRGLGTPGDPDADGTQENFADLGAWQHEEAAGGGGGPLVSGRLVQ